MGKTIYASNEKHSRLNSVKYNRKLMDVGELKGPRLGVFKVLLVEGERLRRGNQWGRECFCFFSKFSGCNWNKESHIQKR